MGPPTHIYGDPSRAIVRDHSSTEKLKTYLRTAWSELRFKVFSTLGTRFVAELTELIFHHLLRVEGLRRPRKRHDEPRLGFSRPGKTGGENPGRSSSQVARDDPLLDKIFNGDEL